MAGKQVIHDPLVFRYCGIDICVHDQRLTGAHLTCFLIEPLLTKWHNNTNTSVSSHINTVGSVWYGSYYMMDENASCRSKVTSIKYHIKMWRTPELVKMMRIVSVSSCMTDKSVRHDTAPFISTGRGALPVTTCYNQHLQPACHWWSLTLQKYCQWLNH